MIYLSLFFWALSAVFNAVHDTLTHHFSSSIFSKKGDYWDPNVSWLRKYKDKDKWYGWINDTVLVWTTDAWHLSKMLTKSCVVIAIVTYRPITSWYWDILILTVIWGLVFELFYGKLLLKK